MNLDRELAAVWRHSKRGAEHLPQHVLVPAVDPAMLVSRLTPLFADVTPEKWAAALDTLPQGDWIEHLHHTLGLHHTLLRALLSNLPDAVPANRWQLRQLGLALWRRPPAHKVTDDAVPNVAWLHLSGGAAAVASREIEEQGNHLSAAWLTLAQLHLDVPPLPTGFDGKSRIQLAQGWRYASSPRMQLESCLCPAVMLTATFERTFGKLPLKLPAVGAFIDRTLQRLAQAQPQQYPLILHLAQRERPL